MYPHLLKVQILMGVLVLIGGYVLGNSVGSGMMVTASFAGTLCAFVIVDRLKITELSGWSANLVMVGILIFSMRDFVGGDSTTKLVSVAKLLTYLQVALFFQKKTPRLCWQLLVLSILQMLEAAIFNLNFEYGIFFFLYFIAATLALAIQNDFVTWSKTNRANSRDAKRASKHDFSVSLPGQLAPVLTQLKQPTQHGLLDRVLFFSPWIIVSVAFSFILFHSLPHSRQDWKGPAQTKFSTTGQSKKFELDVDGAVYQSNSLIFRANFHDVRTNKNIIVNGQPYFRGLAMSKYSFDSEVTGWEVPFDHVFGFSYDNLIRYPVIENENLVRPVQLKVTLEPVSDPMLYSTMPVFKKAKGETQIEYCLPISALTRRSIGESSDIASYKYEVMTLLDEVKRPLNGFPYRSPNRNFPSLEKGTPEYELLTELATDRYPELIKTAKEVIKQTNSESWLDWSKALLEHFRSSNGYQYTLNYRDVQKNAELDPIEDFVANYRTGHCVVYASALTLMLRSVGIPARYVVGFHGGKYNNLTNCYVINGRHAHAWVEAYIPPDDCTEKMFQYSTADRQAGAWLTLDPTPPNTEDSNTEALDLARSIWQDYVISPDYNKQALSDANTLFMSSNSNAAWVDRLESFQDTVANRRSLQVLLVLGTIALILWPSWQSRPRSQSPRKFSIANSVQAAIVNMTSTFSPKLAQWLNGKSTNTVPFYEKFEQVLNRHLGLQREPEQTQSEFAQSVANQVSTQIADSEQLQPICKILNNVIEAFYQARFSSIPLDKPAVADIENQIQNLEQILKATKT